MGFAFRAIVVTATLLGLTGCSGPDADIPAATANPVVVGEQALSALQGKTILLAGATGQNGKHVLQHLHALGLNVRATSRNAAAAKEKFGDQYDWVEADVTQPETLAAAVEGVDIVISAVATAMPMGGNRPEKVDYEGTLNLSKAAKAAGATRFVIITSSSSGVKDHFLNTIGGNVLIWKGKAEEVLVDSGLEYVVVGPAGIDESPGGERAIALIPRSAYEAGMFIGRHDLAAVVIAAAGHPEAANRVFTATNTDAAASADWLSSFASLPTQLDLPTE
ncbi:MAG: SDR family oxidoreductase [Gammaproteobacteria bacterium]